MKEGATHLFHNGVELYYIKANPDGTYFHCAADQPQRPWFGGWQRIDHLIKFAEGRQGSFFKPVDEFVPENPVKIVEPPKPRVGWW